MNQLIDSNLVIEKNNGQSSLSSSYFSNFNINEDMKGIYLFLGAKP